MKGILKSVGLGAAIGLALNQIICYVVSAALRLGYCMLFPAALPERVGGEMNAALCQMLLFMLLGMGVALCSCLFGRFSGTNVKRIALQLTTGIAAMAPAATLAVFLLGVMLGAL